MRRQLPFSDLPFLKVALFLRPTQKSLAHTNLRHVLPIKTLNFFTNSLFVVVYTFSHGRLASVRFEDSLIIHILI